MSRKNMTNIKLGIFVLSGLLFLVLLLYMIGRNSNLFGATYPLKARFSNVQGLVVGNNVRYAGIETGTVKSIEILNDTLVEVTMIIEQKMKSIIRKNAQASIGTEGLVGNRVINISPASTPGPAAEENDLLVTKHSTDPDEMLHTLDETNRAIAEIAGQLKTTIHKINQSALIWSMLNDASIPRHISASAENVHMASLRINEISTHLRSMILQIKNGEGTIGALLNDTLYASQIHSILRTLQEAGNESDSVAHHLDGLIGDIQEDFQSEAGPFHTLFYDTLLFYKINESLDHIQSGTEKFDQNMEALKHNFLFRGYFKKQDRQDKKRSQESQVTSTHPRKISN